MDALIRIRPETILAHGGDLPTGPPAGEILPPDFIKLVTALVNGDDPHTVLKGLDSPASKISATLRRERRKVAILLFGTLAKSIYDYSNRHAKLLGEVIKELETRDLGQMQVTELIKLADLSARWLQPVNKWVMFEPEMPAQPGGTVAPITADTVNMVITQAHQAQEAANRPPAAARLPVEADVDVLEVGEEFPRAEPEPHPGEGSAAP